jgi:hypothetical protein
MSMEGEVILVKEPAGKELANLATFDVVVDSEAHSVEAYCKSYEAQMRTSGVFSDFTIVSKKEIPFSGVKAIEYHCTATAGGMPMEWKSIVLLHRGRILKMSTASLVGLYDLKRESTDGIFQSVRLR